eukprot:15382762-Alexandrium_andersonii.AAC.1
MKGKTRIQGCTVVQANSESCHGRSRLPLARCVVQVLLGLRVLSSSPWGEDLGRPPKKSDNPKTASQKIAGEEVMRRSMPNR